MLVKLAQVVLRVGVAQLLLIIILWWWRQRPDVIVQATTATSTTTSYRAINGAAAEVVITGGGGGGSGYGGRGGGASGLHPPLHRNLWVWLKTFTPTFTAAAAASRHKDDPKRAHGLLVVALFRAQSPMLHRKPRV